MRLRELRSGVFRRIAALALCLCLAPLMAGAQQPDTAALAQQLQSLNAAVAELRTELSRSRQETQEVRDELRRVLDRLGPASADLSASSLEAAEPPPPVQDQLSRLEENQQLLGERIDEQYQTKVESASKYRVKLSGIVLLNLFGNRGRVDIRDMPGNALRSGPMYDGARFGAAARQSELGFETYGPTLGGGRLSANVRFDFFGGSLDGAYTSSGLMRLKTAAVRLDWDRTTVAAGQEAPFISPLSPTSLATLAYPAFSASGNLWTWLPQARIEHRIAIGERDNLSLQGGFLQALTGELPYSAGSAPPPAEVARQPAYAVRAGWTHGDAGRAASVGVGGYYSRPRYGTVRIDDAWAGTADWNIPLGGRFSLSGEFYRGRAIGGLGAAQGRSYLFARPETDPSTYLVGLNAMGGWAQLKTKVRETVEVNAVYGIDNPYSGDLHRFYYPNVGDTIAPRNESRMANVIYRPRTGLILSLEYRRLLTRRVYGNRSTADHVNLGVGVLF